MIQPAPLDLVAHRHAPFDYAILIEDVDLTGATLDMHVRLIFDTPGSPLIDLSPASPPAQGLSLTVAGGDTIVRIIVSEATLEGLPAPGEIGDDLELVYDIAITPSGGIKGIYFRGGFTVRAGSTS